MTAIVTVHSVKLKDDASSAMSNLVAYWKARRDGRPLPTRRERDGGAHAFDAVSLFAFPSENRICSRSAPA
jgi:hypothetical protein